jgi:sec-independent protein translocase protein TatC
MSELSLDSGDGLLRMSFLEHLEELRARVIRALWGFGAIFLLCIVFSDRLFDIVLAPGLKALQNTGDPEARFIAIDTLEQFSIMYVWTPFVAGLFFGAPWMLWQAWAFISPALYPREKRWAAPFVLSTAGLFLAGGLFGYFVALPYGLSFLFALGKSSHVHAEISIDAYFERFVDAMLGIGLVFELPVLIFFLSLLRVVSPAFLLKHSRYAILMIVIGCGARHPHARLLQPHAVRRADVHALLPRHLRQLPAGAPPRKSLLPLEGFPHLGRHRDRADRLLHSYCSGGVSLPPHLASSFPGEIGDPQKRGRNTYNRRRNEEAPDQIPPPA